MPDAPGSPDAPALFMTELSAADWSGLSAWYAHVLGLRVVLRDEPGRFVLLDAGGSRLAIKGRDDPGPSGVRLVFRVADVDAACARLRTLGESPTDPVDHPTEPFREARLADPAGTPVTLFAWR